MPKQPTPPLHLYPQPPLAPTDGIGPGVGMAFVRAYFPRVQQSLRIATAYFSFKGYRMAWSSLPVGRRVQLQILVGKRDGYELQHTVLEDLRAELVRGVKLGSLYDAVVDLYQRMKAGELTIRDARQMERPFHCKFYLSDAASVFHGSANFSANGLQGQAEQLTYSTDQQVVADWTAWFEKVAAGALDLEVELRQLLADWLAMARPFHVYLRALDWLLSPTRELNLATGAHAPVPYQRALAAWAARQLVAYRGAVLLVSTGLGKTVIEAEAVGQLWRAGLLERVLVLAPPSVQEAWDKQLKGRGLQAGRHQVQFGIKLLFRQNTAPKGQAAKLLEELQNAGPTTLILIDEAHEYRNQQQATQNKLPNNTKKRQPESSGSLVFDRLTPALNAGAQVLLLTGSAYGTNRLNLSSLLRLLPPTAPPAPAATDSPPLALEPTPTGPQQWDANSPAAFGNLPVVTVFTYPHALYLTQQAQALLNDAEAPAGNKYPYLPFAHGPGYLPLGLYSTQLYYEPPGWTEIVAVFDGGCFAQQYPITTEGYSDDLGPLIGKTDSFHNQALAAWLSSPAALYDALAHNLATEGPETNQANLFPLPVPEASTPVAEKAEQLSIWEVDASAAEAADKKATRKGKKLVGGSYKKAFRLGREERHKQLAPIQQMLAASDLEDPKLIALRKLISELCVNTKGQAIIFVRQRLTAHYLHQRLTAAFKVVRLKVGCMVDKHGMLKSAAERQRIREEFAPLAHGLAGPARYKVLVCTDADSLGVNLQDADNVINYDWPDSADGLIQRLGRVLRPAPYAERTPHMYTFVPECLRPPQALLPTSRTIKDIARQYNRLLRRHLASTELNGFPVLGTDDDPRIALNVKVDAEALSRKLDETTHGLSTATNSWALHIETLEKCRAILNQLPTTVLHSARLWPETFPRVVVLVLGPMGAVPIVYDIETDQVQKMHDLPVLNLLRADAPEEPAGVNLPRIMRYADLATKRWCEEQKSHVKPNSLQRLAAMYLHPAHQAEDFDYLLKTA